MSEEQPGRFSGEDQHGWSPDKGAEGDDAARGADKAMAGPGGGQGEGRQESSAERGGVSSTDMAPGSPHGAGESTTRSPEDQGEDGDTEGRKGAGRPHGKTDEDDDNVGEEGQSTSGPGMSSGDQGGF